MLKQGKLNLSKEYASLDVSPWRAVQVQGQLHNKKYFPSMVSMNTLPVQALVPPYPKRRAVEGAGLPWVGAGGRGHPTGGSGGRGRYSGWSGGRGYS